MDDTTAPLVLASASPRRLDLLRRIGLHPEVRPAHVDETPRAVEEAGDYVERLSKEKARAVAAPGEIVLAADTTVVLDGRLLGKPENDDEARDMLAALAGREHSVLTGVTLLAAGADRSATALSETRVRMRPLDPVWIDWYIASGEPRDKAGGYAIQGLGSLLVASIEGDYDTVVGLPLALLPDLFERLGLDLLGRL